MKTGPITNQEVRDLMAIGLKNVEELHPDFPETGADTHHKKGGGSNAASEAPSGERAKRDNLCAGTSSVTEKDRRQDADAGTSVATLNPATQTVAPSAVPATLSEKPPDIFNMAHVFKVVEERILGPRK